jgi:hypothetical protein
MPFCRLTITQIVILSLVRNSGGSVDDMELQTISQHTRANIGFLKVRADIHSVNKSADRDALLSSPRIARTVAIFTPSGVLLAHSLAFLQWPCPELVKVSTSLETLMTCRPEAECGAPFSRN